jgi:hypothetical protein
MTRITTWAAGALMAVGLLLAPGEARACEAHAKANAAKAEASKAEAKPAEAPATEKKPEEAGKPAPVRGEVERPLDALDSLMAGKCNCGSKADCTCKKGSCECSKCHKPKRQVMDALRGRPAELKLDEARYDASAGIFI